jgi:hypothetical protein
MLIFYNRESENKSLKLSYFEKSKNIKSWLTFLFLNIYFNIWFAKYYITKFKITIVKETNIVFKI